MTTIDALLSDHAEGEIGDEELSVELDILDSETAFYVTERTNRTASHYD